MAAVRVDMCGCSVERRTVTDYFLNACRRVADGLSGPAGDTVDGTEGVWVQFAASLDGEAVRDTEYRAATCATLVAYAEVLGEAVAGLAVAEAIRITPEALVARLPGVPAFRRERATLVVHAWWSALARALEASDTGGAGAARAVGMESRS